MPTTIVEDRILARIARDAVGWDDGAAPAARADIALGRAVIALRVMGIDATREVTRAVRDDIALALAGPAAARSSRSAPRVAPLLTAA